MIRKTVWKKNRVRVIICYTVDKFNVCTIREVDINDSHDELKIRECDLSSPLSTLLVIR